MSSEYEEEDTCSDLDQEPPTHLRRPNARPRAKKARMNDQASLRHKGHPPSAPRHPFPQPQISSGDGFHRLKRLRAMQQARNVNLAHLNPIQMGEEEPEIIHHVSINYTVKGGAPSFRVRVCKSCGKEEPLIELGTYVDRESAMLVNDCHEIMMNRTHKLHGLVPSDKPFFSELTALRFSKGKLEEQSIVGIIHERLAMHARKLKRLSLPDEEAVSSVGFVPMKPPSLSSVPENPQNIVHFVGLCCKSVAGLLVQYGVSRNSFESQRTVYGLTCQILSSARDEQFCSSIPDFALSLARCLISSYCPAKDPAALQAIMRLLDDAMQKRNHVKSNTQAQDNIMARANDLRQSYSSSHSRSVLRNLVQFAHDTMAETWRWIHNVKCPRYTYPNYDPGDSYTRVVLLRGTVALGTQKALFLCGVLEYMYTTILGTGVAPVEDVHTLLNYLGSVRLMTTWVVFVTSAVLTLLFDLTDGREVLMQAISLSKTVDSFILQLPRSIHLQHYMLKLDAQLLLFTGQSPIHMQEFDRGVEISSISACFAYVLEAVHHMPNFTEAAEGSGEPFHPIRVDPLVPDVVAMHEYGFLLLSLACRTVLTVPEAYYLYKSQGHPAHSAGKGSTGLLDEYKSIAACLNTTLKAILEWLQLTGSGMFEPKMHHALYQTYKLFHVYAGSRRMAQSGSDSDPMLTMSLEIMAVVRDILRILSVRYGIALDLLQLLDPASADAPQVLTMDVFVHPLLAADVSHHPLLP